MIKEIKDLETHLVPDGYDLKSVPSLTQGNFSIVVGKINELIRVVNTVDAARETANQIKNKVNELLKTAGLSNEKGVNCYGVHQSQNGGFVVKIEGCRPDAYEVVECLADKLEEFTIEEIITDWL